MALQDAPDTPEQSPVISDLAYGLDTHQAVDNSSSLFDQASDVITKGVPLTGLQIVNSFANTGVELANVFGANLDKLDIHTEADALGDATGQQGLSQYYDQHSQAIDAASE